MRRARIMFVLTTVMVLALTVVPDALARDDGGQGWYGETTDADITKVMFMTIAFFPVLIFVLTMIQSRLDKRKHAREDAANARAVNADWRGGW